MSELNWSTSCVKHTCM